METEGLAENDLGVSVGEPVDLPRLEVPSGILCSHHVLCVPALSQKDMWILNIAFLHEMWC